MTKESILELLDRIDEKYRDRVHAMSLKKKHLATMNRLRVSTNVRPVVYDVGEEECEVIKKNYIEVVTLIHQVSNMTLLEVKEVCVAKHHYELVTAAFTVKTEVA